MNTGNGDSLPANIPDQADAPEPSRPSVVVEGQTIKQGAPPSQSVGPVDLSPGSVYVDGVATAGSTRRYVPRPGFQPILKASPVNLGGLRFSPTLEPEKQGRGGKAAKVKPAIVVQDQTNRQGAPPVTIKGNKVAYSSGSLQVGKTAVPLVPANKDQPAAPIEVQGTTFTPVALLPKGANGGSANDQEE